MYGIKGLHVCYDAITPKQEKQILKRLAKIDNKHIQEASFLKGSRCFEFGYNIGNVWFICWLTFYYSFWISVF